MTSSPSSAPSTPTPTTPTEVDRGLIAFTEATYPAYQPSAHHRLIAEHLEALERGEIDRLIIETPPRHGKSELVSVRFPAWYLARHPEHQMISASYTANLAYSFSRQARNLFAHPLFAFFAPDPALAALADDAQAVSFWRTLANGGMVAAGVGGPMTGHGAHVLNIDDYLKNYEEAKSEVVRENQWEWYTSTAYTRLMPGGKIVVTATRWHEDDLIGRILLKDRDRGRWVVLRLPAVADGRDHTGRDHAPDPLGRADGEALWPAWYDAATLSQIKEDVGGRVWSALYQQLPTAAEGATFKRQWMSRRYSADLLAEKLSGGQFTFVISSTDTNYKEGTGHDPSVVAVWAADGVDYYLLDVWRKQTEFPELKRAICDMHAKWSTHADLVEEAANGHAAIAELKRESNLALIPVKPVKSKVARADSVAPIFEAGKVVLPLEAPWLMDWIEEHASFPNGMHDDQVDTTSQALARLSGRDAAGFLTFVQQEAMRKQAARETGPAPEPVVDRGSWIEAMQRHKDGAA